MLDIAKVSVSVMLIHLSIFGSIDYFIYYFTLLFHYDFTFLFTYLIFDYFIYLFMQLLLRGFHVVDTKPKLTVDKKCLQNI